jgi:hypothetical protein
MVLSKVKPDLGPFVLDPFYDNFLYVGIMQEKCQQYYFSEGKIEKILTRQNLYRR